MCADWIGFFNLFAAIDGAVELDPERRIRAFAASLHNDLCVARAGSLPARHFPLEGQR